MSHMRHGLIATTLAGVLALGIMGCSSSKTVETTVTDEDGNKTTTTTTTTTDENGTSTTTDTSTESLLDQAQYANEHFGFAFVLPDGFETADHDALGEDISIELFAVNDNDDSVLISGTMDIPGSRGYADVESWAEGYKEELAKAIEDAGEENVDIESGPATVGESLDGACVRATSEDGIDTIYRDYYFFMDADGNGLRVDLTTTDEFVMDDLRDAMVAFQPAA